MERKVSVERLYSLGNYQNVKFVDEITGIPESIVLNKDAMNLLHFAQVLEVENAYYKYSQLRLEKLPRGKLEDTVTDTLEILEQEQTNTWEQLLELIKEKEEEN